MSVYALILVQALLDDVLQNVGSSIFDIFGVLYEIYLTYFGVDEKDLGAVHPPSPTYPTLENYPIQAEAKPVYGVRNVPVHKTGSFIITRGR